MSTPFCYAWRGDLSDPELCGLVIAHGGNPAPGWWDAVRPHSLGWATARRTDGALVGFVNVAWDGADHAFLLDTKTHGGYQRRGIGRAMVGIAAQRAKDAGCEWLHVDFEDTDRLGPFYLAACGFRPTSAGLIHLPTASLA
jgi:ribosomal protein S18 acetylase RimI-like enzyme